MQKFESGKIIPSPDPFEYPVYFVKMRHNFHVRVSIEKFQCSDNIAKAAQRGNPLDCELIWEYDQDILRQYFTV